MGRRIKPERLRRGSIDGTLPLNVIRPKKKPTLDIPLWRRMRKYFALVLSVRLFSVFCISTEFVPDEAWQSTEVAYYFTYGRGHLSWEWMVGLRSHIYPLCIAGIYTVLKFFSLDSPYMLTVAPRVFQGSITAIGDYCFFLFCMKRYGYRSARWSLACALTCWFTFYCGSRTITNSTEMALNSVAMYLLEIDQVAAFVGVVALNFVIRPTAVVVWIPQFFVIFSKFYPRKVVHRFPASLLVGLSVLTGGALVDFKVYGRPMLAWLRFIKFNFLDGKSAQFGEHHPLWYFYSGLPSIVGPNIIALFISLYYRFHHQEWTIITGYIFMFSLIRHKEIRFLLPVLPYIFAVMGNTLYICFDFANRKLKEYSRAEGVNLRQMFYNVSGLCLIIHFLASAYFCAFHQGGIIHATNYVNDASKNLKNPHIWVMMGCYAVPVFTYMHNPKADFQYITCGPEELELEKYMPNFRRYTTNSSELHEFVSEKVKEGIPFPDFILCFDELVAKLLDVFSQFEMEYKLCNIQAHAQFGDDRGMVNVLCLAKNLWNNATPSITEETVNFM